MLAGDGGCSVKQERSRKGSREGEIGTKAQDGLKEARELATETPEGPMFQ